MHALSLKTFYRTPALEGPRLRDLTTSLILHVEPTKRRRGYYNNTRGMERIKRLWEDISPESSPCTIAMTSTYAVTSTQKYLRYES